MTRDFSPLLEGVTWKGTMSMPRALHDFIGRVAAAEGVTWSEALRGLVIEGLRTRAHYGRLPEDEAAR